MVAAVLHLASKSAVFGLKRVGLPNVLITFEFCSKFKIQISYSDPDSFFCGTIRDETWSLVPHCKTTSLDGHDL